MRRARSLEKLGGIFATVAVASIVAACGGSSGNGSSGAKAQAAGSSGGGGRVTLQVWDWGSPAPSVMNALDAQFMKLHPNIVIKHTVQPFASYFTLERSAIASKNGPDIFLNYASPAIFDYQRGLASLNNLASPTEKQDLLGWNLVSTGLSQSGQAYGVPWTGQGPVFYYNKELFKKAGLNPATPPTTWAQFLADCAALKKAGIIPVVAGFKDGFYAEWWADVFASQFLPQATRQHYLGYPTWTNPSIAKGLSYLVQLDKDGYMTPNANGINLFPDTVNNFGAQKGAIFLGLAANNANWAQFATFPVAKHDNLGAFLPPVLPGSQFTKPEFDFGPGLAWSIAKWSSHPQQAMEYLSFLASASAQDTLFKLSGSLPNNSGSHPQSSNPTASEILSWSRGTTYIGPFTTFRTNVEAVYDKDVPEMMAGQLSPAAVLGQMESTQQQTPPVPTQ